MRPPPSRLAGLFVALVLSFSGVATRLVLLQVRDAHAYAELAHEQRVRRVDHEAERGTIYDRGMHELALSLPAKAVYANPRLVERPGSTARRLATVLELPRSGIRRALASESPFVYVARRVDLRVAERVRRLRLPGIGLLDETKRYYPGRQLAAQVLGFVGLDGAGLAGVELQYDRALSGSPGSMVIEQDPSGRPIPQGLRQERSAVRGRDVVLTIDKDLQFQAEQALEAAVRRNEARGGAVVVLDPRTGDVLAMANSPRFDANAFADSPPEITRNRIVTDVYEPGSVNKVITAAAALEEGAVGLREPLTVPARLRVGDKVFRDVHPHPPAAMTLTDIIAASSNVGTIMTAQRLGSPVLDRYLRAFGFGRRSGIGFPGEAQGILLPASEWWSTSMGTIPIGQGIAVTPLQMAAVYATVANGGVRVEPRLVRGTVEDGELIEAPSPARRRVISARTARRVTGMLAMAVESGTGQQAQVPGYWVAGKTGTARKPLEGELGYSGDYVASFIGFAPARRPQIVVAAILDDPVTVYGGIAAAPLFREVATFALAQLRVPTAEPPTTPPTLVQSR